MKQISVFIALIIFLTTPLFSAYFTPVDGVFPDTFTDEYLNVITNQMQTIADEFNQEKVIKLAGNQENFARANNNANSSTLLNGNLYTRTEIKTAAVGAGSAAGVVGPAGLSKIPDDITSGKDSSVGAALNGFTVYVSTDGESFGFEPFRNLLFDLKLGYLQDNSLVSNFTFDSFIAGGGLRYKVYRPEIQSDIMMVRPVTIGTGVYHTSSKMSFSVDDLSQNLYDNITQIRTQVATDLDFTVENSSTTVPLEVVSSARFFGFFNIILGTGFDFVFGETHVDLNADSTVTVSHDILPIQPIKAPDLKLNKSETAENADLFRYKILSGIGFEFAMVTIDVPVTYYPLDNGVALSVLAAAAF